MTMRDEEFMREHHVRRLERICAYFCLTLAGTLLTIEPSGIVTESVSTWVEQAWSGSMACMGLVCLVGSISDRWVGEYSGIPLLSASLGFYAIAAINNSWGESLVLFSFGLLIGGLSFKLLARWKDVRDIKYWAELQGAADRREYE